MARILFGFMFVIAVALFVRHQYQTVIAKVTTPQPRQQWLTTQRPYEVGHKCVMCGGTGRINYYGLISPTGGPTFNRTQICPTCNGTGWINTPDSGR